MCKCEPLKESYEASGELENKCRTSRCAVRVLCTVGELTFAIRDCTAPFVETWTWNSNGEPVIVMGTMMTTDNVTMGLERGS
jgi:hypothetical protein